MKTNRYFDTFQKYEECFNKIWDKFPIGDRPEWRHWWFYRYLQISPSYIAWTAGMAKTRKGGELPDRCADIPGLGLVAQTQFMFGDVLYLDFVRWWYSIARFQFNTDLSEGNRVNEIFQWSNRFEIDESIFDFKLNFFIPAWPARFQDDNFRIFLHKIILEYTPAHLKFDLHFLSIEEMAHFESLYFTWISLLQANNGTEFQKLSSEIIKFLNKS